MRCRTTATRCIWAAIGLTRLNAYASSRDAKLLERQPPLFDDRALAAVRADIEKSVALKSGRAAAGLVAGRPAVVDSGRAPLRLRHVAGGRSRSSGCGWKTATVRFRR